ncbi:MAG: OadG family protein [Clostridia bacterium]|nr:OadG family protein [Clostridia bacterium]
MTLTIPEILIYSVVGILVVITFLAVLAIAVTLISKAIRAMTDKAETKEAPAAAPVAAAPAAAPVAAAPVAAAAPASNIVGTTGELKLRGVDDQTAAILMAIISDTTKIPLNQLRFKRIVRVDSDK